MVSNEKIQTGYEEKGLYDKSGEALIQVAQRYGGCPVPGDFQGTPASGPGQPDLAADIPFVAGELHQMTFNGSFQL